MKFGMLDSFNSQFNEALQVSKRYFKLSLSYDNEKFPKIVLSNIRHVSSIKQERVIQDKSIFEAVPNISPTLVPNQMLKVDVGNRNISFDGCTHFLWR